MSDSLLFCFIMKKGLKIKKGTLLVLHPFHTWNRARDRYQRSLKINPQWFCIVFFRISHKPLNTLNIPQGGPTPTSDSFYFIPFKLLNNTCIHETCDNNNKF